MATFYFLLALLFSTSAIGSTPACLGGVCIDKAQLTEKQIKDRFGKNYSKSITKPDRSIILCFRIKVKDDFFFLKMTIGDAYQYRNYNTMELTAEEICQNEQTTSLKDKVRTKEGITIGSKFEDLLNSYGEPKWILKNPPKVRYNEFFGNRKVEVDSIVCFDKDKDDSLHALFYLSKGFVVGIEISTLP